MRLSKRTDNARGTIGHVASLFAHFIICCKNVLSMEIAYYSRRPYDQIGRRSRDPRLLNILAKCQSRACAEAELWTDSVIAIHLAVCSRTPCYGQVCLIELSIQVFHILLVPDISIYIHFQLLSFEQQHFYLPKSLMNPSDEKFDKSKQEL